MSDFEKTMEEVFGDLHSRVSRQDLFFKLYNHMRADGIGRNSELVEKVERYEKALKFYADEDNFEYDDTGEYTIIEIYEDGFEYDSIGIRAKETLK